MFAGKTVCIDIIHFTSNSCQKLSIFLKNWKMDETNEIEAIGVKDHFLAPVKRIFRYLTLKECENELFLLCYFLILIGLIGVIVLKFVKRTVLLTEKDIYLDLCNFIAKRDTARSVNIIRKHPHLINMFYGNCRYTPFLRACLDANTLLVKYMISEGADIHLKSLNGESAFYLATYHHIKNPNIIDASCIHTLFHAGVNINEPNSKGLTPLQLAAYFGHYRLVRWLLKKGAHTNVTPSPYMLARQQGHVHAAVTLREAMRTADNVP